MKSLTKMFEHFNVASYILGFISTLITSLIIVYLNQRFTKKRELRHQIIEMFKLSSELINEINLFLKSQKHFCENYEEYRKREYHGQGFEPVEDIDNLINIKNKRFMDFFDAGWLDKFYYFFALSEITLTDLPSNLNQLLELVENIYPKREIYSLNDEYQEFYYYIDKELKVKFDNTHKIIRKKLQKTDKIF